MSFFTQQKQTIGMVNLAFLIVIIIVVATAVILDFDRIRLRFIVLVTIGCQPE